jgi:peptidyl-prolyl cis-trans isomerase SurA
MYRFLFIASFIFSFIDLKSQNPEEVLMTIEGRPVTVEEFRYIYEKNNGKEADYSEKNLREYLRLYTNFKLKVAKAREEQLDTVAALQEELGGYKKQLANTYISEKEIMTFLNKELEERQKQDVRFKHLLVVVPTGSPDSFYTAALARITRIGEEIKQGKKSWKDAVKEYTEDPSTKENEGDLGFYTALMPEGFYDLETALYTLPLNKVSDPIKTRLGYHLIMNTERRPARGMINVAHILIKTSNGVEAARIKAAEVKTAIANGEDFAQLATRYSEDGETAGNGGLLPAFGINQYDPIFENAAFALQKDGEVSGMVETKSGIHFIKRIAVPQGMEAANIKKANEAKMKKGDRYQVALNSLIQDIKKSGRLAENKGAKEKFISSLSEDFFIFKWNPEPSLAVMKEPLITFGGDTKFSIDDFARYSKKATRSRLKYERNTANIPLAVDEIYKSYVDEKALEYHQKTMELKYPEFRALMREYEEGILLFEITKQKIWDKANQDSVGLAKFFETKKDNFKTEERANVVTYNLATTDMKLAEKIRKATIKKSSENIVKKFNKKAQVISYMDETLDKGTNKYTNLEWVENKPTELFKNDEVGGFSFRILKKIMPVRNKTLKEARGYVVAEYQDHLEKEWITELATKYKVQVNEAVLSKMIKK